MSTANNVKKFKTYHGTLLHFAIIRIKTNQNQDTDILDLIKNHPEHVLMKDCNEEYPLVLAIQYQWGFYVVKKLLSVFPEVLKDIVWKDNETNVMHYMIEEYNKQWQYDDHIIDEICSMNKDLLNLRDNKKRTILQIACKIFLEDENDRLRLIKKILSFPDLDINNQDIDGNTVLHMVPWKLIP